jgi:hypothetical protein
MVSEALRAELLAMRAEDAHVRQELVEANQLGGPYVPRMEAVHTRNASRLRALIAEHGWPGEDLAGEDGAEAAWLIAQHAVGEPDFQRRALAYLRDAAARGRVPAWHAAYLEDRIALHEGRPQRYGTQWVDDPRDGRARPWTLADPERVDDLRASVGLKPLRPVPGPVRRCRLRSDRPSWRTSAGGSGGSPIGDGGADLPQVKRDQRRGDFVDSDRPFDDAHPRRIESGGVVDRTLRAEAPLSSALVHRHAHHLRSPGADGSASTALAPGASSI